MERPGAAHRDRKGASRRGAPFPFEHGTAVGRRLTAVRGTFVALPYCCDKRRLAERPGQLDVRAGSACFAKENKDKRKRLVSPMPKFSSSLSVKAALLAAGASFARPARARTPASPTAGAAAT